jgi:hypothetical protein
VNNVPQRRSTRGGMPATLTERQIQRTEVSV